MSDIDQIPEARAMRRERQDALRDVLMEEVRRSSTPWWRRSRQGVAVGAGALTLVLAGGPASAYVAFRPADDQASVVCYSAADADAGATYRVALGREGDPDDQNARPSDEQPVAIEDPIAVCQQLWADGVLVAGSTKTHEPQPAADHSVPPLASCTLEEGIAAVFPGDASTCERLGLPQTEG